MENIENSPSSVVAVQFTEREYFSYVAEIARPHRVRRFLQCAAVFALAAVCGLTAYAIIQILIKTNTLSPSFYFPGFLIFFLPLYRISLRFFRVHLMRGHFNDKGSFLRRMQFSVLPDALIIDNDVSHTQMRWRGVLKIVNSKELILFYVDNMQAHIIPKRCFATPEAAEAFYQQALAYWQAAQAAPQGEAA